MGGLDSKRDSSNSLFGHSKPKSDKAFAYYYYYYLHSNGVLVAKNAFSGDGWEDSFERSSFVKYWWLIDKRRRDHILMFLLTARHKLANNTSIQKVKKERDISDEEECAYYVSCRMNQF